VTRFGVVAISAIFASYAPQLHLSVKSKSGLVEDSPQERG